MGRHNVKRDFINSDEYRKPEWLIKMEEIKERLAATVQAPKFIREIKENRIKEGMRARFEAGFAGNPKPDISWWFNGQQMQNSKSVQIKVREDSSTLTLIDCGFESAGIYECRAANDLGSDKTRASLTVNKMTAGEKADYEKAKAEGLNDLVDDEEEKVKEKRKVKEERKEKTQKKEEKKIVKKVEAKVEEKKTYDWKKGVKKVEKPQVVEAPKQERIQLKKPKDIEKPKEEPRAGPQLKPIPDKQKVVEEPKEEHKLKPVAQKPKPEEATKVASSRRDTDVRVSKVRRDASPMRDVSPVRDVSPARDVSPGEELIHAETSRQYYEEVDEIANQESSEIETREPVENIVSDIGSTPKVRGFQQRGKDEMKHMKTTEKDKYETKPAEKVKLKTPQISDKPKEEHRTVEKVELRSPKVGDTKKESSSNQFDVQLQKPKQLEKTNDEKQEVRHEKISLQKPKKQKEGDIMDQTTSLKKPKKTGEKEKGPNVMIDKAQKPDKKQGGVPLVRDEVLAPEQQEPENIKNKGPKNTEKDIKIKSEEKKSDTESKSEKVQLKKPVQMEKSKEGKSENVELRNTAMSTDSQNVRKFESEGIKNNQAKTNV